jgi:O-antigen/teichoic acid export membrane protein
MARVVAELDPCLTAINKEFVKQEKLTVAFQSLARILQGKSGFGAVVQLLVANIFVLGVNVGTGILTARLLGPAGRGELAAMILWPQFLAYVLALGLPSALLYNLKRRPEESDTLVGASLVMVGVMSVMAILAGVLLIPLWLRQYPVEVVRFAQFAMLTAPLNLLGLLCNSAMQARDAFTLYNRLQYLPPLLTLFSLVLLAATHHLTPFTSALAYLLGGLPVIFWAVRWVWRRYRPTLRAFAAARRHLFSYSLRSGGVNVLGALAFHLDRVLVVGFLEPAAMGLYVAALSLSRVLNVFQSAVTPVLFPKASGRPKEEVVALTGRAVRVSATVTALAAAGLILLGPQVLGLLYSNDFTAATAVFRLLVAEAVFGGITMILAQAFMALDRPGMVTILQGVGVGLSIPLLMWLVPRYGLEGAGMALLLSTSARLIFVYACFPVVLKTSPPRLWMWPSEMLDAMKKSLTSYVHKD